MELILASTSPYRQRLLERLQIPFRSVAPNTDETRLPGEDPAATAARLALAKAGSVARSHPDALVIGSDQVAVLQGHPSESVIMGKPGNFETARAQLRASSGRAVCFYTGLALRCAASGFERFHVEPFRVYFREIDDKSIENYLNRERPYDCAGSFKCEGLGIALFQRMEGNDPTSLEGLPLITLTGLLVEAGLPVLAHS